MSVKVVKLVEQVWCLWGGQFHERCGAGNGCPDFGAGSPADQRTGGTHHGHRVSAVLQTCSSERGFTCYDRKFPKSTVSVNIVVNMFHI